MGIILWRLTLLAQISYHMIQLRGNHPMFRTSEKSSLDDCLERKSDECLTIHGITPTVMFVAVEPVLGQLVQPI